MRRSRSINLAAGESKVELADGDLGSNDRGTNRDIGYTRRAVVEPLDVDRRIDVRGGIVVDVERHRADVAGTAPFCLSAASHERIDVKLRKVERESEVVRFAASRFGQ